MAGSGCLISQPKITGEVVTDNTFWIDRDINEEKIASHGNFVSDMCPFYFG